MNNWRDNSVHAFLKSITLKMNVIVQLEFELTYYDVTIQHISDYATGTPCISFITENEDSIELPKVFQFLDSNSKLSLS